jgi:hypothetical protein
VRRLTAMHWHALVCVVWSNFNRQHLYVWDWGIIFVLEGDRNKTDLMPRMSVLLELQWVSLFRETRDYTFNLS